MNNRKISVDTLDKHDQINVFVGGGWGIKSSPKYVKKILILT